jgi:dTDP-4-dehydrorhamnose 3,5-epimerase
LRLVETPLPGCLRVEPVVHEDARGFFLEAWSRSVFQEHGLDPVFMQGNLSGSARGVLRGLHYQWPRAQGKLVSVAAGEVFDVAVDVRRGSPGFGKWFGEVLSASNRLGLWIPPGFAHGFVVLSEFATFSYLVTAPYDPAAEVVLRWDDPAIGVRWPVDDPLVSSKDAAAPTLDRLPPGRLPVMGECAAS